MSENKTVKVREVVSYGGHGLSANGAVNLTFKASYSELVNTIQTMQMLNNDVHISAKLPGQKPMKLGMFRIKSIGIDGDGESTIKFNGLNDYVEMDNLNLLPTKRDEGDGSFAIQMLAESEPEDDEGEEDE